MSLQPFKIEVSEEELEYLQQRLATTRFPDTLTNIVPWEYGTDLDYFKELVAYWRSSYDWRSWEAKLNGFKQYTVTVNGIRLHFVHEPSSKPDAVPLLLLHGWPGSFFEFYKLIPMLQASGDYHIVAPSLPGYGFSSAPKQRGFGVTAIAETVDSLMAGLGYNKYVAQGGDWGGIICRALAKHHHPRCAAMHTNMCVAPPVMTNPLHVAQLLNAGLAPSLPLVLSRAELARLQDMRRFQRDETGYQKIQGTKPQTLAYALQDSPSGLAAWIVEKFHGWTDCKRSPEEALSKDEMLTNICIYWFGGRIGSSMRLYKETLANKAELRPLTSGYAPCPTGVALFPREILKPPRAWAASAYKLVHWSEMSHGGHFAALEQPQLLAEDVVKFIDLVKANGWI